MHQEQATKNATSQQAFLNALKTCCAADSGHFMHDLEQVAMRTFSSSCTTKVHKSTRNLKASKHAKGDQQHGAVQ